MKQKYFLGPLKFGQRRAAFGTRAIYSPSLAFSLGTYNL